MTRFAGELEYEVSTNEEITAALFDAKQKIIEAIPTSEGSPWAFKVYFEATQ